MMLSRRERFIVVTAAVVVALLAGDYYVFTPLTDYHNGVVRQKEKLQGDMERARTLLARKRAVAPKWKEMLATGLKRDPTEAESLILHSVGAWASGAGLKMTSVKPDRRPDKRLLQEITFQASGTGSMNAIARFLWQIETSKTPVRVKELQVGARKEGTDDLTLQVRLSTVYEAPPPPAAHAPDEPDAEAAGETP